MNGLMWYPLLSLLSPREKGHRVWGRFDHGEPGLDTSHLVIAIGALALLLLISMIWRIMQQRAARTFTSENPTKLFRELCAAHGLTSAGRTLLKRLADAHGNANPAMLFVEPHWFDTDTLPSELKESAAEIKRLRRLLFG